MNTQVNSVDEAALEQAAKEYAEGMMGCGEYNEKWDYGDKVMYNTILRAYKSGGKWQSKQQLSTDGTFPYLKSEQEFQIIAMRNLGINYPECGGTFEQCVNGVLMMATEYKSKLSTDIVDKDGIELLHELCYYLGKGMWQRDNPMGMGYELSNRVAEYLKQYEAKAANKEQGFSLSEIKEALRTGVNIGMQNAVPDELIGIRWNTTNQIKECEQYIEQLLKENK